jgi:hypothetical protein
MFTPYEDQSCKGVVDKEMGTMGEKLCIGHRYVIGGKKSNSSGGRPGQEGKAYGLMGAWRVLSWCPGKDSVNRPIL